MQKRNGKLNEKIINTKGNYTSKYIYTESINKWTCRTYSSNLNLYNKFVYEKNEMYGLIKYLCLNEKLKISQMDFESGNTASIIVKINNNKADSCVKLLPLAYYDLKQIGYHLIGLKNKKNKWGIMDVSLDTIQPFVYEEIIGSFGGGIIRVKKSNKYGLLNHKGKLITETKYNKIIWPNYYDNYIKVWLNNRWGYVSKKGIEFFE